MIYRMSGCSLNPAEHPLQKLHKESKILIKEPSPLGLTGHGGGASRGSCCAQKSTFVTQQLWGRWLTGGSVGDESVALHRSCWTSETADRGCEAGFI
uniref:Uncharacterized protein n=1 Tax=Knipowitschia caucasica TaxID=637954 RepID=A0AAV2KX81_KNICA